MSGSGIDDSLNQRISNPSEEASQKQANAQYLKMFQGYNESSLENSAEIRSGFFQAANSPNPGNPIDDNDSQKRPSTGGFNKKFNNSGSFMNQPRPYGMH